MRLGLCYLFRKEPVSLRATTANAENGRLYQLTKSLTFGS